ncbi:MAG: class I SAM-dependent methyltransferase [candidate division Zixibacteria bacterium]|nr:class I SAM-dependent methyltransferase [candidate division Zixibacteria bacterium]
MAIELRPGERLIPEDIHTAEDYIQQMRHYFVYDWLNKQILMDDRIMDLGFGEGYGSRMLSEHCQEITGVDVIQKVVDYANEKYSTDNCKYIIYDGKSLPFETNSLDVAVAFQVIEHIDDDNLFVAELQRVLKKGGKLFMTTPNRATRLKPGQKPFNRFHKREYYARELKELLEKHFAQVDMFGISATKEIHEIEFRRIKRGGLMSLALNMGLRKLLPEALDYKLSRFLQRRRSQKKGLVNEDIKQKFPMSDFRVETIEVDKSLDLFGLAVK